MLIQRMDRIRENNIEIVQSLMLDQIIQSWQLAVYQISNAFVDFPRILCNPTSQMESNIILTLYFHLLQILYFNMQQGKKIFITGTNRGLGKCLVKLLHKNHPQVQIHISSRSSPESLAQQWSAELPGSKMFTYQVDLNSQESIAENVRLIKERNIQFDWVVANAAFGADFGTEIPSQETARNTLQTNVNSTIHFVKQFLPTLSPTGRAVIVSSVAGAFSYQSQEFIERIDNPKISEQEIMDIVQEYIGCAKAKDMGHFSQSAYFTSKALLNAWCRFILPNYLKEGQTCICLHPGWCSTDMGGQGAPLTPEAGAQLLNAGIWVKETNPAKFFNNGWCEYSKCK